MTTIRRIFAGHAAACLGIAVFAACMLGVFAPVIPKFEALMSADSGPFFGFAYRTGILEGFLTGAAFMPQQLYWLIFPPLYAHELTYVIDSFVLALAGVYYLSGRRVHPLAAWMGGLALGLSGYTFTLFSAGHRGYFHMFSCVVWSFGLLVRGFETRRLFYFAMLGLVFAWGVSYQPDVLVLAGMVVAAYVLRLTWNAETVGGSPVRGAVSRMLQIWPRFLVSVLVLVLANFGGVRAALTTQVANREAQMAGAAKPAAADDKKTGAANDADRHSRWIFATNWSLPPEDMLEFVVPGVFGNESMQPPYPYWGRLGRPADEVFQKGRMMPNYRQHTVYLGLVSVLLAFLGVAAFFANRKEKKVLSRQPISDLRSPTSGSCPPSADYSDVPFWCGVWVVCLILAMGRYTPVYRLFYAIPYMEYLRAPVKFHHLVEVATAFLAGFGMDAFLRAESAALRRHWMILCASVTGLLVVSVLIATVAKPQMIKHIAELGLGSAASSLGDYAMGNLARSIGVSVAVCVAAVVALRRGGRIRLTAGCGLLILAAGDSALVAGRYVRPLNVEPFYRANPVVKAIVKASGGQPATVINYATPNAFAQDWFSSALEISGIRNLAPGPDDRESPQALLFRALQRDPMRLWGLCHAQYVIVPRKACEPMLRVGVLADVLDFDLGAGTVRPASGVGEKTLTLARVRGCEAGPRLLAAWDGGVVPDKQAETLATSKSDVSDAPPPAVADHGASGAGEVRVLSTHGLPGVFATRLSVLAKRPGLLVFDEHKAANSEVLVDGRPQTLYTADAVWPAVLVPEGTHAVTLRPRRNLFAPVMGLLCAVGVAVWGLFNLRAASRPVVAG